MFKSGGLIFCPLFYWKGNFMDIIHVSGNSYYIDSPSKIGFYCFDDNGVILIDSGNSKDTGKKVLKLFEEKGFKLKFIINTHSNADHVGGNKIIQDRTGCEIYAKGIEKAFIENPLLEPSFLYGAFPLKELRTKFLMAEPSLVKDISEAPLPDGFEIISLKGHFFDMIGVKTPDNVYFLGDALFGTDIIEKYHVSFVYDVKAFLETFDYIETLSGNFVLSHGNAGDINKVIEANREKTFEIIRVISSICETPVVFEELLKKVFDWFGLCMNFNQYVLVGSSIRSYLSYLAEKGDIICTFKDNRLLWSRKSL